MRKTFILFSLLFLLFANPLSAAELNWGHDYQKALERARQEHKLVYLFIGADKCRFCKKFKETTLSEEEVIFKMKKDFVLLYMSRDQHKIPNGFELYGVPRHYFLTPEGEVIRTEQGIWDREGWFMILEEVVAEEKEESNTTKGRSPSDPYR